MTRHLAITAIVALSRIEARSLALPVTAELGYCTVEPFAVTVQLISGVQPQPEWIFSRELLHGGLVTRRGEGDVRIGPVPGADDLIAFELAARCGELLLIGNSAEIRHFLMQTYEIVPSGEETRWIDFGQELAELLSVTDR